VDTISKAESPVSVFLLVQHRLIREAVARRLRRQNGIIVAGASHESAVAFEHLSSGPIDVLLLDSVETLAALGQMIDADECLKKIKVLLFGMEEDPGCFLRAVQMGAYGCLLNDASSAEMVAAIRTVAHGEAVCPPQLCKLLFDYVSRRLFHDSEELEQHSKAANELTCRQRQLMALVAKGMTNKQIAATLQLSEFTVKNHMRRIMARLQAESRHAAVDAIRSGGMLLSACEA
jgi:DNA-binding NarL/FixJ family response regulator